MNHKPIIALITDFGTQDAYVGTMKGVLLSICPAARLVDLTHAIPPQQVRQAAYVLLTAFRHFPPETVFLVVVDPGVGTAREPVAVQTDQGVYVAPNNGVLSYVLARVQDQQAVVLDNPAYHLADVSQTFHGRDIFSPAAAHLANGVAIERLGSPADVLRLDDPTLVITAAGIHGEVLHVDHFGNVITSIGYLAWTGPDTLSLTPAFGAQQQAPITLNAAACSIVIGSRTLQPIHTTYGAVPPGTLTPLVGSSGQLEIGVNQGNAAQVLGVSPGDPVILRLANEE
ncbi:MAG: SAM-dependent chlorinase/fluorinase [Anaerolineae bacterium]|nr:SAM-dependent chlorinase/fluorinase [Anaerolineae bacterium]